MRQRPTRTSELAQRADHGNSPALGQECDELIAIFVTIIKRSRHSPFFLPTSYFPRLEPSPTFHFLILPSSFILSPPLMQPDHHDLRERTTTFALRVIRTYAGLPKTTEAQILGKQVLRSGTSIGANYREAYRARSKPEFIAKCGDALREAEETAYWLELLVDSGITSAAKLAALRQECDELIAIFVTIIKRSRQSPS
jgi:four helix bundle protein